MRNRKKGTIDEESALRELDECIEKMKGLASVDDEIARQKGIALAIMDHVESLKRGQLDTAKEVMERVSEVVGAARPSLAIDERMRELSHQVFEATVHKRVQVETMNKYADDYKRRWDDQRSSSSFGGGAMIHAACSR